MTTWNIDTSHSAVQFTVRHMMFSKVRGAFTRWQGSLEFDPANPAGAKATARIEAASIDTHEPKRDEHLRSADFFDVASFPALTFASRSVEKAGEKYRVTGDLTIRGNTREVVLEAEFLGAGKNPWGQELVGFSAKTSISRKEFGLTWNQALETGGVLVGDQIDISIDVEAVRAQAGGTQAA